ncbi:MAG: class I SAM-dependent methyltransferase [Labilithrix sp.]|nr:class I SAM-dependent methyltransferase [Labilithrix sp.]
MQNVDIDTVDGFGDEWTRFDHSQPAGADLASTFADYFAVFPWATLPEGAVGFDAGCGTGRWARFVAERVGGLHCVDASERALDVARKNLASFGNVTLHAASIAAMPFPDSSMDFGYSLGVLHHMPDTGAAIASCVRKLKPGAPLLLYLYYAFDNRPSWFRSIWRASDALRTVVSRMPPPLRYAASQALAASVYWPLARSARALERLGVDVDRVPLSAYRDRSFYMMRNDALDRFGTRLEQRFTRAQMQTMMERAGLTRVTFHDGVPYWCAVGFKQG